MAAYREHVTVSGLIGTFYGLLAVLVLDFTPVQAALAAILTWVAGMLPDLDSQSGKPVREIFGLFSAVIPMALIGRFLRLGGNAETAILLAIILWALIRYGGSALLSRISVHRGMFHSIPALLISAELTFLCYQSDSPNVKFLMAAGVALGFLSHLILDEAYSVEFSGVRVRLNKSAGSALKVFGKRMGPNVVVWSMLVVLTYATLADVGLIEDGVDRNSVGQEPPRLIRQAREAMNRPLYIR
ncbi:MAG: metal-dependent hydrolase [Planctomycetaceae bacterium]|nr:metal-dependent hydrolase [Planctomycetaceae bacterium]